MGPGDITTRVRSSIFADNNNYTYPPTVTIITTVKNIDDGEALVQNVSTNPNNGREAPVRNVLKHFENGFEKRQIHNSHSVDVPLPPKVASISEHGCAPAAVL